MDAEQDAKFQQSFPCSDILTLSSTARKNKVCCADLQEKHESSSCVESKNFSSQSLWMSSSKLLAVCMEQISTVAGRVFTSIRLSGSEKELEGPPLPPLSLPSRDHLLLLLQDKTAEDRR